MLLRRSATLEQAVNAVFLLFSFIFPHKKRQRRRDKKNGTMKNEAKDWAGEGKGRGGDALPD